MNTKYLVLGISVCIVGAFAIGVTGYVEMKKFEKESEINAQTVIEQTKIQQDAEVQRTKERMNLVPWYKGGENKE